MACQLTMTIKRFKLSKPNINPNFIGSWIINEFICNELIDYFESNKQKHRQGVSASGLRKNTKDRVDISLTPRDITLPEQKCFQNYFENIFECYKDYNIQWPFLASIIDNLDIGAFNLGRYNPGQHYQGLHCERASIENLSRLFAFMTYLNDVDEGGSTYFKHYDLKVKPQKGLTLIWPAEWTHAHKGNKVKSGSKYIITGWLNIA